MELSMTDKLELFEYLKSVNDIEYLCDVLMDGEGTEIGLPGIDLDMVEALKGCLYYLKGYLNTAINN